MNKEKTNKTLFITYILIDLIIYVSFLTLDILKINDFLISSKISLILKYISIVINFLAATYFLIKKKSQGFILIILAFLFTLVCDYLLLFKSSELELTIGVLLFFFVQLFYYIRFMLYTKKRKYFVVSTFIRVLLPCLILAVVYFVCHDELKTIYVPAAFYFVSLVMNFIDSFTDKKYWLLSIAFLLFIACDVSIGVTLFKYNDLSFFLRRAFYLPSQILLFIGNYKVNK